MSGAGEVVLVQFRTPGKGVCQSGPILASRGANEPDGGVGHDPDQEEHF